MADDIRRLLDRKVQEAGETLRAELNKSLFDPRCMVVHPDTYQALESAMPPFARYADQTIPVDINLTFKGTPVIFSPSVPPNQVLAVDSSAANRILRENYLPKLTENIFKERPIMETYNYTYGPGHRRTATEAALLGDFLSQMRNADRYRKEAKKARKNITLWRKAWPSKVRKGTAIRWKEHKVWRIVMYAGMDHWTGNLNLSTEGLQDHLIRNGVKPRDIEWIKR